MYLCTRNYDLKRGGTFETAKAGTFHSVTAGTLIPLSPFDGSPIDFFFLSCMLPCHGSLSCSVCCDISQPLFILVLPPILFRHFQKFSKLLHPLRFQLPCIHPLPIRLNPVQHIVLFNPMFRRITFVGLNEVLHFFISFLPTFFLSHTIYLLPCFLNANTN